MRTFVAAIFAISCGSLGTSLLPISPAMTVVSAKATPQESDAQKRSEEILASFNKSKHKVREVFGVRKERYKEIRSDKGL